MTDQFAYPPDREKLSADRVAALERLLIEKGIITSHTVDKVLAYFESEMTPLNGKKIVVKAWTDPEFAARVVDDTPAAIAEPRDAHPLQLLVSALHARARLHNKIPDARPAKPHKQPAGIDIKKLQAGDHDD